MSAQTDRAKAVSEHSVNGQAAHTSGLNRWVPRLTIGAAILHFIVAFTLADWSGIASDGFVNTVGDENVPDNDERMSTLWFSMAGIGFLALGTFARWAVKVTGHLPAHIGGYLLLAGVPMTIMQPVSGGVLLTVIGVLAILAARRSQSTGQQ